jgi:hypothetical protein
MRTHISLIQQPGQRAGSACPTEFVTLSDRACSRTAYGNRLICVPSALDSIGLPGFPIRGFCARAKLEWIDG